MKTDRLAATLRVQEGTGPMRGGRHFPYRDSVGKLTIGYGRNLDDRGLSPAEANQLLAHDIDDAHAQLTAAFPWFSHLDDVRQRVVANLAFNMGLGDSHTGLLSFTRTLALIEHGEYAEASREMVRSQWAAQVGHRAVVLAEMLRTGVDS